MLSHRLITFLFAAIYCVKTVNAEGIYTVALRFELASDDANCTSVSDRIRRVSNLAMHRAGMDLMEDKDHWHTYLAVHNELLEEENLEDVAEERFNHASLPEERRLGEKGCNDFCRFMCLTAGNYCACCSCCGSRTTRKRALRKVKIGADKELDDIKKKAAEEAIALLGQWHKHISCLAKPYNVSVGIMAQGDQVDTRDAGSASPALHETPARRSSKPHKPTKAPTLQACTRDVKVCPDGSMVVRDPLNSCEFFPCPVSTKPPKKDQVVTRDAGGASKPTKPTKAPTLQACTRDVNTCPDGSIVVRDPLNNCEFFPCPVSTKPPKKDKDKTPKPTEVSSEKPSSTPSTQPSLSPSNVPSLVPSGEPSLAPSGNPSDGPSGSPSVVPSAKPSTVPSVIPSSEPSMVPSESPSLIPSTQPSLAPSDSPSLTPSGKPSLSPSDSPSTNPSVEPSSPPSPLPSGDAGAEDAGTED